MFAKTFLGWILTIIVAGLVSACIFALGIYTPSRVNTDYLNRCEYAVVCSVVVIVAVC